MRMTPSQPPLTAFVTSVASGRSRYVSARMSIGRLTPAMPSTRPGMSSFAAIFDGVPPYMSDKIRTLTYRDRPLAMLVTKAVSGGCEGVMRIAPLTLQNAATGS